MNRGSARGAILLLLVLAGAVRLMDLGGPSLWLDEAHSLYIATQSWGEMLDYIRTYELHPPLHYALLFLWVRLVPFQEFWLRLPHALSGVVAVMGLAWVGRRLGGARTGWICGYLAATSQFVILFDSECRMYGPAFCATVAFWVCLLRLYDSPGKGRSALLVLSAWACAYLEYRLALILVTSSLVFLFASAGAVRRRLFLGLSVGALGCLPVVPLLRHQASAAGGGTSMKAFLPPMSLELLSSQIPALAGGWFLEGSTAVLAAVSVAFLGLILSLVPALGKNRLLVLGAATFLGSWAALVAYSCWITPAYSLHSSVVLSYPFLLGCGLALGRLPRPAALVLCGFWGVFNLYTLVRFHRDPAWGKQNWKQLLGELQPYWRPDDTVVVVPGFEQFSLLFYWRPEDFLALEARDFLDEEVKRKLRLRKRIWWFFVNDQIVDRPQRWRHWLNSGFKIEFAGQAVNGPFHEITGNGIDVYLVTPTP
ncbi:MAG: glycosyltransferase family 39 protein [Candidatus Eremiobacteraeota bacterium]|nr:glycosyltransferase family 39 protein [Candidatus Eremiobacteraeota bacterium]MCW5872250.1 glycosyltransferase family 39 protein [Candidatus Eremiobacteraeota bacterium]